MALVLIGAAGIIAAQIAGADAATIGLVAGLVAPTLVSLLALLRTEQGNAALGEVKAGVDLVERQTNGALTQALRDAVAKGYEQATLDAIEREKAAHALAAHQYRERPQMPGVCQVCNGPPEAANHTPF